MRTTTQYITKLVPATRYQREKITIEFSKSGVKQQWELYFNKGRLLTDKVYTSYQDPILLRSGERCKTLEDVLLFLYTYSHAPHFVRIVSQLDILGNTYGSSSRLKQIIDLGLDVKKINGSVYFGRYTIAIGNGLVTFTFANTYHDGTFVITGWRDLLRVSNRIIGGFRSEYDFLLAVKKLEVL